MSKTGRAAVFEAPNSPFVIREYPVRDVNPGEVLVRVVMATICRSDIHSYQGHRPNPCPGILGHEIIGVVAQIGSDIGSDMRGDALEIGDRVTWTEFFHRGDSYQRDIHGRHGALDRQSSAPESNFHLFLAYSWARLARPLPDGQWPERGLSDSIDRDPGFCPVGVDCVSSGSSFSPCPFWWAAA